MPIKIMTWNVWYDEKVNNLIEFIQKINPDIFCGQELTVNSRANPGVDVAAQIAAALGYDYYFYPQTDFGSGPKDFRAGNGIISRYPILEKSMFYVQKADSSVTSYETENRAYIEVVLKINDKQLTVGTTHLSYSNEYSITEKRLAEMNELLKAVNNHHKHFILAGDMNAKADSIIVKELEKLFIHADPNTDRATWTTKPFSYQGFEADTLDWRLDYIFATEDINIVSNRILQTRYSDHLPILSEFEI